MASIELEMPVKVPASVTFDTENIYIDGVTIGWYVIPQLLYDLTHPDPRKWYRLERIDNAIHVHVKISEENPDGNLIANSATPGSSNESPGG